MKLTDQEKRMFDGEEGEATSLAMQMLAKLGEAYDARRMVPVHSGHAGCVYPQFGAAVDLMERFAGLGGAFRVVTTVNPVLHPCNFDRFPGLSEPASLRDASVRQIAAIRKLGVVPTWSCTPYFHGNLPRLGEPLCWAESSAIIFANSALGARANRTADGIDVASSIVGRTPEFGLLITENRAGTALAKIEVRPKTLFDYSTLGYIIGKQLPGSIPVIEGLPGETTTNHLKALGAAMATRGGIAMFHAVGMTPEATSLSAAFQGGKAKTEICITDRDVRIALVDLNASNRGDIDAVAIGCPHPTIGELQELANLLHDRIVRSSIDFCLFASPETLNLAAEMGYIDQIEAAGVKIFSGDCLICHFPEKWGWKCVATDSAKYACTLPSHPTNLGVRYATLRDCVAMAAE